MKTPTETLTERLVYINEEIEYAEKALVSPRHSVAQWEAKLAGHVTEYEALEYAIGMLGDNK